MKKATLPTLAIVISLSLGACASKKVAEQLDAKLAQESTTTTSLGEIPKHAIEQITKSKMSEQQKASFNMLIAQVMNQNAKTRIEVIKLKKVLFKSLATDPYNEAEVNLIKKRIARLEREKLKNMFSALDEVRSILGEKGNYDEQLMDLILEMDRGAKL